MQVVRSLNLPQETFTAWKHCWEPYRNPRHTHIAAVEQMQKDQIHESAAWYRKLVVTINGKHYHGLFDKVLFSPSRLF